MKDIYETPYGTVKIDVDASALTISLSSGFDSALTFYMMALAASKYNPDVEIYPITARRVNNSGLDYFDRVDNYANACKVTDWVREKFPLLTIHDNILCDADLWWYCDGDEIVGRQHNYLNSQRIAITYVQRKFRKKSHPYTFSCIGYNGVTKNPDFELAGNNPEKSRNLPESIISNDWEGNNRTPTADSWWARNNYADDNILSVDHFLHRDLYETEPFRNGDKRATFWVADHLGILADLLKISRSCEGNKELSNNWTQECHHCWWCYERTWAHETYATPDAPDSGKIS